MCDTDLKLKSEILSTKSQTISKSKSQMSKTLTADFLFTVYHFLNFGHLDLFGI